MNGTAATGQLEGAAALSASIRVDPEAPALGPPGQRVSEKSAAGG